MATTYEGSKQQRYYLKNKEVILEKKRNKAAADKAKKEALKAEERIIIQNDIPKIKNMGGNIYSTVINEEYFKNHLEMIAFLNNIVDVKYDLAGMSYLKILTDYMALVDVMFTSNTYPWNAIEKTYGISLKVTINQRNKYYR